MTLITKAGAALRADRSVSTIDRALAAAELRAQRIGGRVLFDPAEVDRWIESRKLPIATAAEMLASCRT